MPTLFFKAETIQRLMKCFSQYIADIWLNVESPLVDAVATANSIYTNNGVDEVMTDGNSCLQIASCIFF